MVYYNGNNTNATLIKKYWINYINICGNVQFAAPINFNLSHTCTKASFIVNTCCRNGQDDIKN